ncbi:hypothetical protein BLNAU_513 [Blattamonas nauphoetae]|uniref:Uncharacterized protein n=1 Tax=Blattamonas nauphoetae TaxID=2049346 RepID=A0ABQ9YLQ1_9EUKA|nr:hypothetical protein BLNAU_513 [Blattamonas nauphoetae]
MRGLSWRKYQINCLLGTCHFSSKEGILTKLRDVQPSSSRSCNLTRHNNIKHRCTLPHCLFRETNNNFCRIHLSINQVMHQNNNSLMVFSIPNILFFFLV